MPDPGPLGYLADILREAGMMVSTGFGIAPIPFVEIEALGRLERLEPEECRILRAMSAAFVAEWRAAEDMFRLPPWEG